MPNFPQIFRIYYESTQNCEFLEEAYVDNKVTAKFLNAYLLSTPVRIDK